MIISQHTFLIIRRRYTGNSFENLLLSTVALIVSITVTWHSTTVKRNSSWVTDVTLVTRCIYYRHLLQWNLPEGPPLFSDHLTKLPIGSSISQIAISETSCKRPPKPASRVVAYGRFHCIYEWLEHKGMNEWMNEWMNEYLYLPSVMCDSTQSASCHSPNKRQPCTWPYKPVHLFVGYGNKLPGILFKNKQNGTLQLGPETKGIIFLRYNGHWSKEDNQSTNKNTHRLFSRSNFPRSIKQFRKKSPYFSWSDTYISVAAYGKGQSWSLQMTCQWT